MWLCCWYLFGGSLGLWIPRCWSQGAAIHWLPSASAWCEARSVHPNKQTLSSKRANTYSSISSTHKFPRLRLLYFTSCCPCAYWFPASRSRSQWFRSKRKGHILQYLISGEHSRRAVLCWFGQVNRCLSLWTVRARISGWLWTPSRYVWIWGRERTRSLRKSLFCTHPSSCGHRSESHLERSGIRSSK